MCFKVVWWFCVFMAVAMRIASGLEDRFRLQELPVTMRAASSRKSACGMGFLLLSPGCIVAGTEAFKLVEYE